MCYIKIHILAQCIIQSHPSMWSVDKEKEKEKEKESDNDSSKSNTNSKSRLNRQATPFVPKHAKSKYDAAGELIKDDDKDLHSTCVDAEGDHTFTSLYSDSDSNLFVLEMAAAIQGSGHGFKYHYHVPDGILSSPTCAREKENSKETEKEESDAHYNRILKDYPFNYSATPSPKQHSQNTNNCTNGFAVDLQSLGYNVSPKRQQNIEYDHGREAPHITSKDLFDKSEAKPKHDKQAVQRAPIRLSQLF
eukprot:201238_1